VRPGEVLAVAGLNGSGKTTLLHALAGAVRPDEGEALLAGRSARKLGAKERARLAALTPQSEAPAAGLTALDLVLMGRMPWSEGLFESKEDLRIAQAALEACGVAELSGRMLDALSGGERQAVWMARAWAQNTPLILMDEPTSSLDYRRTAQMRKLALRAAAEGRAVIAATHDLVWAAGLGGRLLLLKEGRTVWTGPASEASSGLEEAFGIPFIKLESEGRIWMLPDL
jgi:iron complex transport system ATP-binding protein